jgi:large subunit ribosomal protein L17
MRHGDKVNALGRKKGHRVSLLKNLSIQLITHKRIITTVAKAKALRRHIEPLLTKAKNNTTHSRRVVFSYLQNKDAVTELFTNVAEKIVDRNGGYTRVVRTGFRRSDGAEMALIELVDFNAEYNGTEKTSGKTRRSRRGRGGKGNQTAQAVATTATAAAATAAATVEDKSGEEE